MLDRIVGQEHLPSDVERWQVTMHDLAKSPTSGSAIALLLQPTRLWSATEILKGFASVPKLPAIYAWYFDEVPGTVASLGGQAAIAACGCLSLAGRNFCPKPEPSVPFRN